MKSLSRSFSRGSSQPRDWPRVSCIAGRLFTNWVTNRSCLSICKYIYIYNLCWGYSLTIFQLFHLVLIVGPKGGNGNPPQYSCLENPMDRGAWWATTHGIAKSRTRLSTHALISGTLRNPKEDFMLALRTGGEEHDGPACSRRKERRPYFLEARNRLQWKGDRWAILGLETEKKWRDRMAVESLYPRRYSSLFPFFLISPESSTLPRKRGDPVSLGCHLREVGGGIFPWWGGQD